MSDAVWLRHANPWSGWTRMLTCLPFLALAIWSRAWIGPWAILAVALAVFWIWINPRAFPAPESLDNWMSKGVLGERVFLAHRDTVAAHHIRAAVVLSLLSVPGAVVLVYGLLVFWWEGAVFGTILTALPKIWFVDRMVWIFEDQVAAGRAVPGWEAKVD